MERAAPLPFGSTITQAPAASSRLIENISQNDRILVNNVSIDPLDGVSLKGILNS